MRNVFFAAIAFDQFVKWQEEDEDIFRKIVALIQECRRDPFKGTGKPEPLKFELKSYWSRRINLEHRLVYRASADTIEIISCRYHY